MNLSIIKNLNIRVIFFFKSFLKFTQLYFVTKKNIYTRKRFSWKNKKKKKLKKLLQIIFLKLFLILAHYNDQQILVLQFCDFIHFKYVKVYIFYKYNILIHKSNLKKETVSCYHGIITHPCAYFCFKNEKVKPTKFTTFSV